jgi:hypothetical protein
MANADTNMAQRPRKGSLCPSGNSVSGTSLIWFSPITDFESQVMTTADYLIVWHQICQWNGDA